MRLVLGNGLQPFLAACFCEVAQVLYFIGSGVIRVDLGAHLDRFRGKHVVDFPVTRRTNPVVTVVRQIKPGVVNPSDQTSIRQGGRRLLRGVRDLAAAERQTKNAKHQKVFDLTRPSHFSSESYSFADGHEPAGQASGPVPSSASAVISVS